MSIHSSRTLVCKFIVLVGVIFFAHSLHHFDWRWHENPRPENPSTLKFSKNFKQVLTKDAATSESSREKICKTVNKFVNATGMSTSQVFGLLWHCPPTRCCGLEPNPTPATSTIHKNKKSLDPIPSPPPGPTRMAILQAGLLASWFEKETIKYIVKPLVDIGWHIDFYVGIQNYTGNKTVRYKSPPTRKPRHQNKTRTEVEANFTQMVQEAGGNVVYFNIIEDLQNTGIISLFNWDHLTFRLTNHVSADKANPVRQFLATWELYEKAMAHERSTRRHYNWVLRLREDAGWLAPPAFELADPEFAYFRHLTGVGGTPDKAFLLPGKHAMSMLHHMAFGLFTVIEWHKLGNPEHLLDIGLTELYNVPSKMSRGKVNEQGKMIEFGLCVTDLLDHVVDGECFRTDYIGIAETWPEGMKPDGSDLTHRICSPGS